MGCVVEEFERLKITASVTSDMSLPVPGQACPEGCTGPEVRTESVPILFGKWGPAIDRTVQVCPVTGTEHRPGLLHDIVMR